MSRHGWLNSSRHTTSYKYFDVIFSCQVKLAVYEGGVEKAYMIFTGLGSNYINWFSADRLVESSWKDLKSSAHNYFSILG